MDLGPALKLGNSESHAGGRLRATILADACEALVGAVFIDGGYHGGGSADRALLEGAHAQAAASAARSQDHVAGMGAGARPADAGLSRARAHRARITIRNSASPWYCPTGRRPKGMGTSKRAAEQAAAAAMLTRVGVVGGQDRWLSQTAPAGETRCGFVALIGAPNAGKSTLLNALVGSKVTIVSRKVQTTRALIRGIAIEGESQLIFVDTPGIFAPRRRLDRAMVTTAWSGAHDADLVGVLIDARKGLDEEAEAILDRLAEVKAAEAADPQQDRSGRQGGAADAGEDANDKAHVRGDLHDLGADRRRRRRSQDAGSPSACRRGRGSIRPTRCRTRRCASSRPKSRAKSCSSGCTRNCRITRRSRPKQWKELRDGDMRIEQTIYVERESQRKIVLGKGGADHQGDRRGGAQGDRRDRRSQGAPVPVREGARGLGRRPGALPRHGAGVSRRSEEYGAPGARFTSPGGESSAKRVCEGVIRCSPPMAFGR